MDDGTLRVPESVSRFKNYYSLVSNLAALQLARAASGYPRL